MQTWTVTYSSPKFKPMGKQRAFSNPGLPVIARGTLVATSTGWRPIELLSEGEEVWTFDDGLQRLLGVKRRVVPPHEHGARAGVPLVRIPARALGNERDIVCTATAGIMVECENASDPMGEPYAVLPASALVGVCDVSAYELEKPVAFYTLQLNKEQAVYLDSGLPFHFEGVNKTRKSRYDVKTTKQAEALLTDTDLNVLAFRKPYEEFFTQYVANRA